MSKKYIEIEYNGTKTYNEIAIEVAKLISERDCAIDFFEKIDEIKISEEKITYGNLDTYYEIMYDGVDELFETNEISKKEGVGEFSVHIEGTVLSNRLDIKSEETFDFFRSLKIDEYRENNEFDYLAKSIINISYQEEELKEILKKEAKLWAMCNFDSFKGDVQYNDNFDYCDGTIIEAKALLLEFKYKGKEYRNICVLSSNNYSVIRIDYPIENGQIDELIQESNPQGSIEIDASFEEYEKKYFDIKKIDEYHQIQLNEYDKKIKELGFLGVITNPNKYKSLVKMREYHKNEIKSNEKVLEIAQKEYDRIKDKYNKMKEEYLLGYKSEQFEKVVRIIGKMKIAVNNITLKNMLVEEAMADLNSLIGLSKVKDDVKSMVNLIMVNNKRKEMNLPVSSISYHLVFSGNPGTGKTTVARLLAKIYKALGIIKYDKVVEVDRQELVAGYVGQTAIKTQKVIDSAMGAILFIDEAYTLSRGNEGDFGQEAIDTLLKEMEDNRDNIVVIVAGYKDLMKKFISSNPGLESRFNKYIEFEDYTPDELYQIFELNCKNKGYEIDNEAKMFVKSLLLERYNNRDENYANARDVRNIFEKVIINQSSRIVDKGIHSISKEELTKIVIDDFKNIKL